MHQEGRAEPPCHEFSPSATTSRYLELNGYVETIPENIPTVCVDLKKKKFWYFNFISNFQTWILAPLLWHYFRSSLKIEFLMPKEDLLQKLLKSEIQTLWITLSEIFWESLPSNIIEVVEFSFPIISFKNNVTSG